MAKDPRIKMTTTIQKSLKTRVEKSAKDHKQTISTHVEVLLEEGLNAVYATK